MKTNHQKVRMFCSIFNILSCRKCNLSLPLFGQVNYPLFTSNLYLMYIICLLDLITSNNPLLLGQLRHDTRKTKALFLWPVDLECLFAPLQPAGHTKAQKGHIDSTQQGVVALRKGNSIQRHNAAPNQRAPVPFCGAVEWTTEGSSEGRGLYLG